MDTTARLLASLGPEAWKPGAGLGTEGSPCRGLAAWALAGSEWMRTTGSRG